MAAEKFVTHSAISIASEFLIATTVEQKIHLSAALSVLAIAANADPAEAKRLNNVARNIASGGSTTQE